MRRARINFQRRPFHQLGREQRRVANGHNLVVVAVNDQRRHVELLQIRCKVGFRKGLDAVQHALESGLHSRQPERFPQTL